MGSGSSKPLRSEPYPQATPRFHTPAPRSPSVNKESRRLMALEFRHLIPRYALHLFPSSVYTYQQAEVDLEHGSVDIWRYSRYHKVFEQLKLPGNRVVDPVYYWSKVYRTHPQNLDRKTIIKYLLADEQTTCRLSVSGKSVTAVCDNQKGSRASLSPSMIPTAPKQTPQQQSQRASGSKKKQSLAVQTSAGTPLEGTRKRTKTTAQIERKARASERRRLRQQGIEIPLSPGTATLVRQAADPQSKRSQKKASRRKIRSAGI